jgi:HD-like signal output (HDOD) protein
MSEVGDLYFNCSCDSTIVLPKGKHPWYRPEKFMSQQAATVFNRFAGQTRLPLLSQVALEAQRLISDEKSAVQDIVDALKMDGVLSLWILEIADMSRPKSSAPIKSLSQAINILGRNRLQELITISSAARFRMKTKSYNRTEYLMSSMMTALVAQELASIHGNSELQDLAFVSGSLCNVGKMLGAICFPEEVDAVYKLTQNLDPSYNWRDAEEKVGAVSHVALGEIAGALWGVSPEVLQCITLHHTVIEEQNPARFYVGKTTEFTLHEIVTFANEISKHVLQNSHLSERAVLVSCLTRFGLREADFVRMIDSFADQLMPKIKKTMQVLGETEAVSSAS